MSFSGQIKEELEKIIPTSRHCQLAELVALYNYCHKEDAKNQGEIVFSSENEFVVRKCFTLLKKTFNMYKGFSWDDSVFEKKGSVYRLTVNDVDDQELIMSAVSSATLTQKSCCRRAYIRGAFLAIGSVSDPQKSYHLEFVCQNEDEARSLEEKLSAFMVEAKIIQRKRYYIVYVKDGAQIVDTLNVMGAHIAMMDFENMRIIKEVRNSVNRKLNCEMANIGKTVTAAQKQIDDISRLMRTKKYKSIPDGLKEMAELRIQYPEATLKELGELASPPLGKSGVNHRLRKLCELAEADEGGEL